MIRSLTAPYAALTLALVSAAGLLLTLVAGAIGHLGPAPELDPLTLTISDFAISNGGGAIELGMVALALASLALAGGMLAVRAPLGRGPVGLLLVWTIGLLVAAAVPTDPLDAPAMTLAGYVHRYASVAAFVSLPVAALLMSRRFVLDARWNGVTRSLRWLAVGSGASLLVLLYVAFPGDRVLMGLTERVLVGLEIALLAVLLTRLVRIAVQPGPRRVPAGYAGRRGVRREPGDWELARVPRRSAVRV